MPSMNPEILSWARTSAGLSVAEAARKLGIGKAYGRSPEQRLEELESGAREPTRPMLVKMAKQYRRPLITFYLEHPPKPRRGGLEFRTLAGSAPQAKRALLDALMRELLARQSLVHDVLAEEHAPDVPFPGSLSLESGVAAALAAVQDLLGRKQLRRMSDSGQTFNKLRDDVEATGIFTLLKGDLGSHHTALDTTIFRGAALRDPLAPFIIVNDNDAKTAWSFTLLHEFVHLLLGNSSCFTTRHDMELERFCDDVASSFLLPADPIDKFRVTESTVETTISDLADEWHVSRTLISYRLLRAGKIQQRDYRRLADGFRQSWLRERQERRERSRESNSSPPYYVVRRHRAGKALLDLVRRYHFEGSLPTTRAATVLGVKPTQVESMLAG